jgi:hypothetical protein
MLNFVRGRRHHNHQGAIQMKFFWLCMLTVPLALAGCNHHGARASGDFNAAGNNIGQGNVGPAASDIGQGFSNGAVATGTAIKHTANQVGNSVSQ